MFYKEFAGAFSLDGFECALKSRLGIETALVGESCDGEMLVLGGK